MKFNKRRAPKPLEVPLPDIHVLSAGLESDSESMISPKTLTPMQQLEATHDGSRLETIEAIQRHELLEIIGNPTIRQRRLQTNLDQGKVLLPLTEPIIYPTRIKTPWYKAEKQYAELSNSTRRHKLRYARKWDEHLESCIQLRRSRRPSYVRERPKNNENP